MYFLIRVHITNRKKKLFQGFLLEDFYIPKTILKIHVVVAFNNKCFIVFHSPQNSTTVVMRQKGVKRNLSMYANQYWQIFNFVSRLQTNVGCRYYKILQPTRISQKKTETDILWWNGREVCFPPNFSLYIFVFTKQIFTYKFLFFSLSHILVLLKICL